MNVLIVDIGKVDLDTLNIFLNKAAEVIKDDMIVLPKGIDILQDVPIEWLKDIRVKLDAKIRELDKDALYCPLCEANHQYIAGEVIMSGDKVVSVIYRCDKCKHVWEVDANGENLNCEN